jgi:hypothetical protein
MGLGTAALSGILPGIGPAIHGGATAGPGQALASGGASLAAAMAPLWKFRNLELDQLSPEVMKSLTTRGRMAVPLSVLAAMGAAIAGNKMRES